MPPPVLTRTASHSASSARKTQPWSRRSRTGGRPQCRSRQARSSRESRRAPYCRSPPAGQGPRRNDRSLEVHGQDPATRAPRGAGRRSRARAANLRAYWLPKSTAERETAIVWFAARRQPAEVPGRHQRRQRRALLHSRDLEEGRLAPQAGGGGVGAARAGPAGHPVKHQAKPTASFEAEGRNQGRFAIPVSHRLCRSCAVRSRRGGAASALPSSSFCSPSASCSSASPR